MGRLAGKSALITGGASGLGAGTAQRFVEEGANVFITDVQAERGETVAHDLGAQFLNQDVTDEDNWISVISQVIESAGRLDVLVNNAGIFTSCPVDETPLDQWQKVMDINLTGVFLGCKHGVAAMKNNPEGAGGSIINLSSVTGLRGQRGGCRLYGKQRGREITDQDRRPGKCRKGHPLQFDPSRDHQDAYSGPRVFRGGRSRCCAGCHRKHPAHRIYG